MSSLFSHLPKSIHAGRPNEKGQGLVEYALILTLVAVVVIVILAVMGPSIAGVFCGISLKIGGGCNGLKAVEVSNIVHGTNISHIDFTIECSDDVTIPVTVAILPPDDHSYPHSLSCYGGDDTDTYDNAPTLPNSVQFFFDNNRNGIKEPNEIPVSFGY